MPASGAIFDPWQEFVVPPFPIDVLPGVIGEFVTKKSADIGVDLSGMAMATLAACSGIIHHCSRINLKHHGTWWMHPNIWVLLVAQSSWKKTPAIDAAVDPIRQFQADVQHAYRLQRQLYEQDKKAGNKNAQEPEPPVRNIVNNTTIEKLADLLSRTNRGILVVRDEIAGWIGGMDKYNTGGKDRSSDRAFWLESWNGGPQTYDRVIRGETFIPTCRPASSVAFNRESWRSSKVSPTTDCYSGSAPSSCRRPARPPTSIASRSGKPITPSFAN